jgi:hypothetical protein
MIDGAVKEALKDTKKESSKVPQCYKCKGPHKLSACPDKEKLVCSRCSKPGHFARNCDNVRVATKYCTKCSKRHAIGACLEKKEAETNGPSFENTALLARSVGLARIYHNSRIVDVGCQCTKIWNVIVVPIHLLGNRDVDTVELEVIFPGSQGVRTTIPWSKGVSFGSDTVFFPVDSKIHGVPNAKHAFPKENQKCGRLSYKSVAALENCNYNADYHRVQKIYSSEGKADCGYSSKGGDCAGPVFNTDGKVIGFHNYTKGYTQGMMIVTEEMVRAAAPEVKQAGALLDFSRYQDLGVLERADFDLSEEMSIQVSDVIYDMFPNRTIEPIGHTNRRTIYKHKEVVNTSLESFLLYKGVELTRSYRMAQPNPLSGKVSIQKYDRFEKEPYSITNPVEWRQSLEWLVRTYKRYLYHDNIKTPDECLSLMDLNTSPGYPLNLKYQNKKEVLESCGVHWIDDYIENFEITPDELMPIWMVSQKKEIKSVEKLMENNIRTFLCSAMDFTVLSNTKCSEHNERYYDSHFPKTPSFVGASKFFGNWHSLYCYLNEGGFKDRTIALDMSSYDASESTDLMNGQVDFRCEMNPRLSRDVMTKLYEAIVKAYMVLESGIVCKKNTGNSSGSGNTIVDNGTNLERIMYCCWLELAPMHLRTYDMFKKYVRFVHNGDDIIMSVHVDIDFFTIANITAIFLKFGVIVKSEYPHYAPTANCTFLSNGFEFNERQQMWLPKPNMNKVLCSLMYGSSIDDIRWHVLRASALRLDSYGNLSLFQFLDEYIAYVYDKYSSELVGEVRGVSMHSIEGLWFSQQFVDHLYSGKEIDSSSPYELPPVRDDDFEKLLESITTLNDEASSVIGILPSSFKLNNYLEPEIKQSGIQSEGSFVASEQLLYAGHIKNNLNKDNYLTSHFSCFDSVNQMAPKGKQTRKSGIAKRQPQKKYTFYPKGKMPNAVSKAYKPVVKAQNGFSSSSRPPAERKKATGFWGSLGNLADRAVNWVTGSGDYKITSNSLMHEGKLQFTGSTAPIVRHTEFVGNILATEDFETQFSLPINPGIPSSFPWLASMGRNYEQYRMKGLVYTFKSLSGEAVTGDDTSLGSVLMVTHYNSLDADFTDKRAMCDYEFSTDTKPSISAAHAVECARGKNVLNNQYVRYNVVAQLDEDIRLNDIGRFQLATIGCRKPVDLSPIIGELWVTYDVEFSKPRLPGLGSGGVYSELRAGSLASFTFPTPGNITPGYTLNGVDLPNSIPVRYECTGLINAPMTLYLPNVGVYKVDVRFGCAPATTGVYSFQLNLPRAQLVGDTIPVNLYKDLSLNSGGADNYKWYSYTTGSKNDQSGICDGLQTWSTCFAVTKTNNISGIQFPLAPQAFGVAASGYTMQVCIEIIPGDVPPSSSLSKSVESLNRGITNELLNGFKEAAVQQGISIEQLIFQMSELSTHLKKEKLNKEAAEIKEDPPEEDKYVKINTPQGTVLVEKGMKSGWLH